MKKKLTIVNRIYIYLKKQLMTYHSVKKKKKRHANIHKNHFFFFSFCSQTKMTPNTILITLHYTIK